MNILACVSEGVFTNGPLPLAAAGRGNGNGRAALPVPNPCDELAVEAAVRLKERHGGRVTLVTVGSMSEATMGAYLGLGVDEGLQVLDEGLDSLGPVQVAWLLAQVIRPVAPDLVLCGERATGGPATGLVPIALAEFLSLPVVTEAAALEVGTDDVTVERLIERGDRQVLQAPWPAVVTVARAFRSPRYPALAKARRATRRRLSLAALGITRDELDRVTAGPQEVAREKARPRPKRIYVPPSTLSAAERMAALMAGGRKASARKEGDEKFLEGSPPEVAAKIIEFLKRERILEW
ncbi:MAG: hypothetical protein M5U01_31035 [Ardenticatenaceae bacterium]|nr:hypothetical protein [Ardenticatenaceae bacterium]